MAKTAEQVKPNFAPAYAALYPELARICVDNGYALAVHGSMARDFDLVAIPWTAEVSKPEKVIDEIVTRFAIKRVGDVTQKEHGRIAYMLSVGFGECALDLSFMPTGRFSKAHPLAKFAYAEGKKAGQNESAIRTAAAALVGRMEKLFNNEDGIIYGEDDIKAEFDALKVALATGKDARFTVN